MSNHAWHIAVLIPACNEEALLPRCLRSVERACLQLPANCSYDVILVADASRDRTVEIGENMLEVQGTVVVLNEANVGKARSLAAEIALQRYRGNRSYCWLANTDADCEVPSTWLTDQLATAKQGVEGIAGIIDIDSFAEHDAQVPQQFRFTYILHSNGTHTHVHGANLGVRADVYLQAGGWHSLQTAEDHDLWRRLKRQGCKLLSTSKISVTTSGRRIGRAPHGFAETLAAHNHKAYEYV